MNIVINREWYAYIICMVKKYGNIYKLRTHVWFVSSLFIKKYMKKTRKVNCNLLKHLVDITVLLYTDDNIDGKQHIVVYIIT